MERSIQLRQAWERYRSRSFPPASDDDTLSELHSDLALFDSDVAGVISHIIDGLLVPKQYASALEFDQDLEDRIVKCRQTCAGAAASDAEAYLDYLHEIRQILEIARPLARVEGST